MSQSQQSFLIGQCRAENCKFRFPVEPGIEHTDRCPVCGSKTTMVRWIPTLERATETRSPDVYLIEALLDNIRSAYNVGAIFRTADSAGIGHLHLCGITPTPDHRKVAKTALGAQQSVSWSTNRNGLNRVLKLKECGYKLCALENSSRASLDLFRFLPVSSAKPIVLIVGNERSGVDPGILEYCDYILAIPMHGRKGSLNVGVAFGIAAYQLRTVCERNDKTEIAQRRP